MRWLRDRRGQALVETALVITTLLFLLMGIFDLGRAVYIYSDLCETAREVGHFGSLMHPRDANVAAQHALKYSQLPLNVNQDVAVTFTNTQPLSVNVQLTYRFVPVTPIIAALVGQNGFMVVARSATLVE